MLSFYGDRETLRSINALLTSKIAERFATGSRAWQVTAKESKSKVSTISSRRTEIKLMSSGERLSLFELVSPWRCGHVMRNISKSGVP